jgi:hypothetical protein
MKIKHAFFLLIPALLFTGCTGYQVGSPLPDSIRTVSVLVENETDEPSIEVQVMKSLRAELQMDGRLALAAEETADAVLKVTLTNYRLNAVAFDQRRGTMAREYRLDLAGRAVFYDAETGAVLQETPMLRGESDIPYGGDLTSAKLSGLPAAADDLARKAVSTTVTAW